MKFDLSREVKYLLYFFLLIFFLVFIRIYLRLSQCAMNVSFYLCLHVLFIMCDIGKWVIHSHNRKNETAGVWKNIYFEDKFVFLYCTYPNSIYQSNNKTKK